MSTAFVKAISFDWETFLPIIFFILYGVAQLVGSRKKSGEQSGEDSESGETGVDPLEKARQIREEIKRKIEERTHAPSESQRADQTPDRGEYNPFSPEPSPERSAGSTGTFQQSSREQHQPSTPQPEPAPIGAPEPGEFNQPDIHQRLREQQKRLQEARRRQREAMQQARKIEKQAAAKVPGKLTGPPAVKSLKAEIIPVDSPARLRRSLIQDLKDPSSLRKAVLLREVLDPPLGLRN